MDNLGRAATRHGCAPESTAWVGLDNFTFMLGDPLFWKAVRNTFVFAAGSVFLQLPLSLGLASFRTLHHVEWHLVSAATMLSMVPIVVLFFLAQKAFVQGVTLTVALAFVVINTAVELLLQRGNRL